MQINKYVLSQEADIDLEEIFEYSYEEFRLNQAINYLGEIDAVFIKIVNTPEIGKTRNELKQGLYSIPIGMHIVFYRILTDHVRIVRVLYGGRAVSYTHLRAHETN
jgi:toxin ParE1/3/4